MNNQFKNYSFDIVQVLNFVSNNTFSDFYKKKYKELDLTRTRTYEDFQKIPFLEKEEILNLPFEKRFFVSKNQVFNYSFSSGTTNVNRPLALPQIRRVDLFDIIECTSRNNIRRLLVLLSPSSQLLLKILTEKRDFIPVTGDINKLELTARLSLETEIDGIISTPTILYFFLKELDKVDFDKKSIKWISLSGEICSQQKLDFFKDNFPNAEINFKYAATETGSAIGNQCQYLSKKGKALFHPNHKLFIEILNQDKTVKTGEIGEIVITDIYPKSFPLIRYKTGDFGSFLTEKCECGKPILKVEGRSGYDVLKLHGTTLLSAMIDESLSSLRSYLQPTFQMVVEELRVDGQIKPKLTLRVVPKSEPAETTLIQLIKNTVTENLFLTPEKTLSFFVEEGIFLPLEIELTKEIESTQKTKAIIFKDNLKLF